MDIKVKKKTILDYPLLMVEWDYTKNSINPEDVSAGSHKKCGGSVLHVAMNGKL